MSPRVTPVKIRNPVEDIRAVIAEAEARGVKRKNMLLRLTHRDASVLKRSPAVADAEVSFEGGGMSFLGIAVEVGNVTVSELVAG
jgi:hypothetical protein